MNICSSRGAVLSGLPGHLSKQGAGGRASGVVAWQPQHSQGHPPIEEKGSGEVTHFHFWLWAWLESTATEWRLYSRIQADESVSCLDTPKYTNAMLCVDRCAGWRSVLCATSKFIRIHWCVKKKKSLWKSDSSSPSHFAKHLYVYLIITFSMWEMSREIKDRKGNGYGWGTQALDLVRNNLYRPWRFMSVSQTLGDSSHFSNMRFVQNT